MAYGKNRNKAFAIISITSIIVGSVCVALGIIPCVALIVFGVWGFYRSLKFDASFHT